jgi:hypothetical protein
MRVVMCNTVMEYGYECSSWDHWSVEKPVYFYPHVRVVWSAHSNIFDLTTVGLSPYSIFYPSFILYLLGADIFFGTLFSNCNSWIRDICQ